MSNVSKVRIRQIDTDRFGMVVFNADGQSSDWGTLHGATDLGQAITKASERGFPASEFRDLAGNYSAPMKAHERRR